MTDYLVISNQNFARFMETFTTQHLVIGMTHAYMTTLVSEDSLNGMVWC